MKPMQLRALLAAAGLVTLGLIWFAPDRADEPVSSAVARNRPSPGSSRQGAAAAAGAAQAVPLRPGARPELPTPGSLFAGGSWYVAPPPPPSPPPEVPAPPSAPVAPPLPFTFMGKYIEDGITQVLLLKGNRLITAVEGDTIDANYRVQRIDATGIVLLYLPLKTPQILATGSTP